MAGCALVAERVRDALAQQGQHAQAKGAEQVRQRIQEDIDAFFKETQS
jgi:hypothetical protein